MIETEIETEIEIEHLQHRYATPGGTVTAIEDLCFSVSPGEVLGFLGPNGAGKSTTMRILAGYLQPTGGTVRIFGRSVLDDPLPVQRRLGYLPEGAPAWGEMTPRSLLRFAARVRGLDLHLTRARQQALIDRLGLEPVLGQRIETLSRGFRRRVGLALALLHDPDLLILDEPTDGLDPNQKHEVRTLIAELAADGARQRIVIVSTHILEEVEAVCSRALVIDRGRLRADASPADLLRRSRWYGALRLRCSAPFDAPGLLGGLPTVTAVEPAPELATGPAPGTAWTLFTAPGDAGWTALTALQARQREASRHGDHWSIAEISIHPGRLDDVFRTLTDGAGAKAP